MPLTRRSSSMTAEMPRNDGGRHKLNCSQAVCFSLAILARLATPFAESLASAADSADVAVD